MADEIEVVTQPAQTETVILEAVADDGENEDEEWHAHRERVETMHREILDTMRQQTEILSQMAARLPDNMVTMLTESHRALVDQNRETREILTAILTPQPQTVQEQETPAETEVVAVEESAEAESPAPRIEERQQRRKRRML